MKYSISDYFYNLYSSNLYYHDMYLTSLSHNKYGANRLNLQNNVSLSFSLIFLSFLITFKKIFSN